MSKTTELLYQLDHGPLADGLRLLPGWMTSLEARALILKIVMQESLGIYRDQLESPGGKDLVLGPALGLGQFERGGACTTLLRHRITRPHILHLLEHYGIDPTPDAFWRALKVNDSLAMAACRVNLLWLPQRLPSLGDANEGFSQYLEAWRPGAWDRGSPAQRNKLRDRWQRHHNNVNYYLTHVA